MNAIHVPFWFGNGYRRQVSRTGGAVHLNDLLIEAVEKADAIVAEKTPHLSNQERAEKLLKMLRIGAIKYADPFQ